MDIANIKPISRTIEIKHPSTGEALGIRVTISSTQTENVKQTRRRLNDMRIAQETRKKTLTTADAEKNGIQYIASAVESWDWYGEGATFHGEKPTFSRAKVIEVMTELDWFKNQIDEELADDKAFFEA